MRNQLFFPPFPPAPLAHTPLCRCAGTDGAAEAAAAAAEAGAGGERAGRAAGQRRGQPRVLQDLQPDARGLRVRQPGLGGREGGRRQGGCFGPLQRR